MPRTRNADGSKNDRMYQHVRKSYKQRGASEDRAEEIAARTVNKERREKGETRNRTTQGTGNPNTPLAQRSKQELYNKAKSLHISGRSNMNKAQLVEALKRH